MPESEYKLGRHKISSPTNDELLVLGGWHKNFGNREYGLNGTYDTEEEARSKAHSSNNQGFTTKVISASVNGKQFWAVYAVRR